AWADYDNDGLPDLVVGNYRGNRNLLYHNEGEGRFTSITNSPIVSAAADSSFCAWGDYDNDGYFDLFIAAHQTNNALYHNNGNGTFTKVTNSIVMTDYTHSFGGAWGDYDNDGFLDLLVSGVGTGCWLYHNN